MAIKKATASGFIDNRKILKNVSLEGRGDKLAYINRALIEHDPKEVISHFRKDSARDFRDFASGVNTASPEKELPDISITSRGNTILIDGEEAVTISDSVDDYKRKLIIDLLHDGARAWRGQCIAHVVACYDDGEVRAVDNAIRKIRAAK